MSFGTDKCRTQTITAGVGETVRFELRQGGAIEQMDENESYKYLEMQQTRGIERKYIKETLKKKFFKRVEAVLKTKLSEKHTIKAINIYAISPHIFLLNNKMDTNGTTRYPNKNKQVTHRISYTSPKIGHRKINITKETRRKRANRHYKFA
jgi:hypothetical protein